MRHERCLAVLRTLAYAAVFSYPLSDEEVGRLLITSKAVPQKQIMEALSELESLSLVQRRKERAWILLAKKNNYRSRERNKRIADRKLKKIQPVLLRLQTMPTIDLLGISGALAWEDAEEDDDIDLFVVTAPHLLWLTRILILVVLEWYGVRRTAGSKKNADKLCLNMLVDQNHLALPVAEQDLFSAHEVVMMKPLFIRGTTHQDFLRRNRWVQRFLGNATNKIKNEESQIKREKKLSLPFFLLYPLEFLAKTVQLWYMKKRRTSEVITQGYVRFHPQDARISVLSHYSRYLVPLIREFQIKTISAS